MWSSSINACPEDAFRPRVLLHQVERGLLILCLYLSPRRGLTHHTFAWHKDSMLIQYAQIYDKGFFAEDGVLAAKQFL
jgi:hypothetical protein